MYFKVIYKVIVLYFLIIGCYRIMGKKEVGKLSVIDLIVSIFIADFAAISVENYNSSIFLSVIPIVLLVILEVSLSYFTLKNNKLRDFFDGKPSVIIKNGQIRFEQMTKLRYNLEDLMTQLREQEVRSIEEVKYAVLENNGKLSVFKKGADYPFPIIVDGKIDMYVLREIKKDIKWLDNILEEKNIKIEDVFYAFYAKNKTFIIKKSELI